VTSIEPLYLVHARPSVLGEGVDVHLSLAERVMTVSRALCPIVASS
jgi:hypothetical protein